MNDGIKINVGKIKVKRHNGTENTKEGKTRQVQNYRYFCSMLMADWKSVIEESLKIRISMAKEAT